MNYRINFGVVSKLLDENSIPSSRKCKLSYHDLETNREIYSAVVTRKSNAFFCLEREWDLQIWCKVCAFDGDQTDTHFLMPKQTSLISSFLDLVPHGTHVSHLPLIKIFWSQGRRFKIGSGFELAMWLELGRLWTADSPALLWVQLGPRPW